MLAALLALLVPLILSWLAPKGKVDKTRPPRLCDETIPFVSNAWQFFADKRRFVSRARNALEACPVVRYWMGPVSVNLVSGSKNLLVMFKGTPEPWVLRIMKASGYSPQDIDKFSRDQSGVAKIPRPGRDISPEDRIWHSLHHVYAESMTGDRSMKTFATSFKQALDQFLPSSPTFGPRIGEWVEDVRVGDFVKRSMTTASTRAVFGPRILEDNPDFVEAYWQYDKHFLALSMGLPGWLNKPGVRARDRFRNMFLSEWRDSVEQSPICRALDKWAKSFDLSPESIASVYMLVNIALNSNAVATCTWVVLEIFKDPHLFQAVKQEITLAHADSNQDMKDGNIKDLDPKKLVSLPLLQSIFIECLRLRMLALIMRASTEPMTIGEFSFPEGAVFQSTADIAHLDESVWGTPEHPASEFWAYRHIKEVVTVDQQGNVSKRLAFTLPARRAGSFFPFGGGINMCPGRNLAKSAILLVAATIVTRFDVEFVEWVSPKDGSHSERPAESKPSWLVSHPDREMKVRWRRRW